jgi:four helix bundle protein
MSNDEIETKSESSMTESSGKPPYDLEERTACFGENIIQFLLPIKPTPIRAPIISQLVRAATSVGANYCEADAAISRKEFRYRIGVCGRESKETKFWIRMFAKAMPEMKEAARPLWREADELNRIFASIARRTDPDIR